MKVIVEYFDVNVNGNSDGLIQIFSKDERGKDESILVPFFGFGKDGNVISHNLCKDYCFPQKEWIDKQVLEAAKYYYDIVKDGFIDIKDDSMSKSCWNFSHPTKKHKLSNKVDCIFVSVFSRSDHKNEIGINVGTNRCNVCEYSVVVNNSHDKEIII